MQKKDKKEKVSLEIMKRSRPRVEIQNRSTVFENKKKYKRSRDKKIDNYER